MQAAGMPQFAGDRGQLSPYGVLAPKTRGPLDAHRVAAERDLRLDERTVSLAEVDPGVAGGRGGGVCPGSAAEPVAAPGEFAA